MIKAYQPENIYIGNYVFRNIKRGDIMLTPTYKGNLFSVKGLKWMITENTLSNVRLHPKLYIGNREFLHAVRKFPKPVIISKYSHSNTLGEYDNWLAANSMFYRLTDDISTISKALEWARREIDYAYAHDWFRTYDKVVTESGTFFHRINCIGVPIEAYKHAGLDLGLTGRFKTRINPFERVYIHFADNTLPIVENAIEMIKPERVIP